jgi:cation diffusion facilitator family transporter
MVISREGQAGLQGSSAARVKHVTWVGLIANLVLAAIKLAGGLVGNSQAVVADAVHTLTDSSTDVAILLGVRYWSRGPDRDHPHGHRRIETLVTAAIGFSLGAIALGLAYRSVSTLRGSHEAPPGWVAFGAAVLSITCKEILYRWTAAVGKRVRSSALVANAWHHRSDAFSSVPVAVAVAWAHLMPRWYFIDHLAGVIVSVFILRAAVQIVLPALRELTDAGASDRERLRLRNIAREVPGVSGVHALRTRYLGEALAVDMHVLVDGSVSVKKGHEIAEIVKAHLLAEVPELMDVVVHVEPAEDANEDR